MPNNMIDKLTENWDKVLETLKEEYNLTDISISTWISPIRIYSFDGHNLVLTYDDDSMKLNFVRNKYSDFLKSAIADVLELETLNLTIDSLSSLDNIDNTSTSSIPTEQSSIALEQKLISSNINKNYTFDTFVVGSNNNIAQAASLAVSESPGDLYNPLFIYGGAGLGKTHLMHAIGNYVLSNNPNSKVLYASSEEFTNELVSIIRNDNHSQSSINDFREKYRNVDILLIDDIQFISGKERTQEEFFHTFNTLYLAKKQIVISSDKPPKDMDTLDDRLRTRFSTGLTVDIQKPDYETRLAIITKKANIAHLNIPDDVFSYIVENITSNVRDLEGALNKIVAFSKLSKQPITLEFSKNILSDVFNPVKKEITTELIIETVAEHFDISKKDICSRTKKQDISLPRQIIMYLSRNLTQDTLESIAKILGRKDHTTVMNGEKKIAQLIETDPYIKETVEIIKKKINPN